MELVALSHY